MVHAERVEAAGAAAASRRAEADGEGAMSGGAAAQGAVVACPPSCGQTGPVAACPPASSSVVSVGHQRVGHPPSPTRIIGALRELVRQRSRTKGESGSACPARTGGGTSPTRPQCGWSLARGKAYVQTAAGAVVFSTHERRGPAGFLEARFPGEAGVGEGWLESEQVNPGSASPTNAPPTKRRKSQKKKSKEKTRKAKDRSGQKEKRRRRPRGSRSEEEGEAEEEEDADKAHGQRARRKKRKAEDKAESAGKGKKAKGSKQAKEKKAGRKEKKAKVKEQKKGRSFCEGAPPAWGGGTEEGGEAEAPAQVVLGRPCQQTVACPGSEAGVGSVAEACPAAGEGSPGQGTQCLVAASAAGPPAQQAYLYVGAADPEDADYASACRSRRAEPESADSAYARGPGWGWAHVPTREVTQCRLPGGAGDTGGPRVYRNRQFSWKACGGQGAAEGAAAAFCWRMNGGQGPEPTA